MAERLQEADDSKLVEGLSHEPVIVQIAEWIADNQESEFIEPSREAMCLYANIHYGVTDDQVLRALGLAEERVWMEQ